MQLHIGLTILLGQAWFAGSAKACSPTKPHLCSLYGISYGFFAVSKWLVYWEAPEGISSCRVDTTPAVEHVSQALSSL